LENLKRQIPNAKKYPKTESQLHHFSLVIFLGFGPLAFGISVSHHRLIQVKQ
jgi:hypothetical protein